jgi:hypothetical protein
METVIQEMEADQLPALFDIPLEMKHGRVEVTIRQIPNTEHAQKETINWEAFNKFKGEVDFREHVQKKLAEGYTFNFDTEKYLNGSMTEDDWQNLFKLEKQAWGRAVKDMAKKGKYGPHGTDS